MTGVLKVILTEVLVRLHVESLWIYIHNEVDSVVVKLTSSVSSKELVALREAHVANEWVLKLTDDSSFLIVGHCRSETDSSVFFESYCEGKVHLQCLAAMNKVFVCNSDDIAFLRHCRSVFSAVNLHFLLLMSVVEESPEVGSACVVVSCLCVFQGQQSSIFADLNFCLAVLENIAVLTISYDWNCRQYYSGYRFK